VTIPTSELRRTPDVRLDAVETESAVIFIDFALNLLLQVLDLPKSFYQKWSSITAETISELRIVYVIKLIHKVHDGRFVRVEKPDLPIRERLLVRQNT
jgi:hypothetical protein